MDPLLSGVQKGRAKPLSQFTKCWAGPKDTGGPDEIREADPGTGTALPRPHQAQDGACQEGVKKRLLEVGPDEGLWGPVEGSERS